MRGLPFVFCRLFDGTFIFISLPDQTHILAYSCFVRYSYVKFSFLYGCISPSISCQATCMVGWPRFDACCGCQAVRWQRWLECNNASLVACLHEAINQPFRVYGYPEQLACPNVFTLRISQLVAWSKILPSSTSSWIQQVNLVLWKSWGFLHPGHHQQLFQRLRAVGRDRCVQSWS